MRFDEIRVRLQATIEGCRRVQPARERLRHSAFARLQAQLDSMPVIEQAKGILMAQQQCGPDEAFDLLRRASQRANVRVSVLAAQIVERVAGSGHRGEPGAAGRMAIRRMAEPDFGAAIYRSDQQAGPSVAGPPGDGRARSFLCGVMERHMRDSLAKPGDEA